MKLTVLGRSGRYPERNGGTSSYLLRTNEVTLLLDMGSGAIAGFQNYVKIGDIDAVLFSHLHGDHMADFLPFNYMAAYLSREINKPIKVYRPTTPESVVQMLGNDRETMIFHDIRDGMSIHCGDLTITFLAVNHPVECYAMRITDGKSTLLYTGDTTLFEGIESIFEGADVVLGDACVLEKDWTNKSPHIGVKSLARMTQKSKLILTHLPDNEAEIADILREALSENANAVVAEVGKTYDI